FEGATLVDLMFAIQNKPHKPLAGERPVPRGVVEVIDRCLAKRPERRYADAGAVAQALEGAEHTPIASLPAAPGAKLPRKWVLAGGAVAASLVVGAGAWLALRGGCGGAARPRRA